MEMQKHFIHDHPKNSTNWRMSEVQSLASDPIVYSLVGPTSRRQMKVMTPGENTVCSMLSLRKGATTLVAIVLS